MKIQVGTVNLTSKGNKTHQLDKETNFTLIVCLVLVALVSGRETNHHVPSGKSTFHHLPIDSCGTAVSPRLEVSRDDPEPREKALCVSR